MKTHDVWRLRLFWCAFLLYLVATTLQFTMLTEVGGVAKVLTLARYLSFALAGVKILWDWALLGLGERCVFSCRLPQVGLQGGDGGGVGFLLEQCFSLAVEPFGRSVLFGCLCHGVQGDAA